MTDDPPKGYASPPCSLHELDPAFRDPEAARAAWPEVNVWRKAERERLIGLRQRIPVSERAARTQVLTRKLDEAIGEGAAGAAIGLYWPFRGEPDLRGWAAERIALGARVFLPVVVEKRAPLVFREWRPGAPLTRGVWNIPIPESGAELEPDIVISPLVGFDAANYRLGYGGGFYDRTLAAMARPPLVIGVGFEECRLDSIRPQPHDIPMSLLAIA